MRKYGQLRIDLEEIIRLYEPEGEEKKKKKKSINWSWECIRNDRNAFILGSLELAN